VIPLALDTSTLTACGNDYHFDKIFSRLISSLGKNYDVLISISTSGKSKNIINALKQAKKQNIKTISFLGQNGGIAKKFSDVSLIVNSNNVARIQESHIFLGHFIFQKVEENIIRIK
jgi:D-sedoheptulose 7-phosphate isomerase